MSEREDFEAWLKTWALPGNTSREDAMYAAWKERASRTAPDALQAEVSKNKLLRAKLETVRLQRDKELKENAQLEAEVERLREEVEPLKNSNKGCEDCFIEMRTERDALKADAERFKYVLSQIPANLGEIFCQCITATDDDIIEAVDAARTAKPGEACPLCNGDCSAANPPVTNCPLQASAKPGVTS